MPVTITRPAQPHSVSTARAKPSSSLGTSARIASASSRSTRSAMRRRSSLLKIPLAGGPEMAPRPPALGRAPAPPWRASGTQEAPRPPALGRAPAQPWRASGTQEAPRPPELGRARAKPWRALGTRDVSSCPTLGVNAVDRQQVVEQAGQVVDPQHVRTIGERPAVGQRAIGILVHLHEERVHAERDRGARERGHVLALAARAIPRSAR